MRFLPLPKFALAALLAATAQLAAAAPTAPFERLGSWMNAYTFVRQGGESWERLAQRIYGDKNMAAELEAWNEGGARRQGRVIFYNSVTRPDDKDELKVLTEDFGQSLKLTWVQPGDTLSSIAKRVYGSANRWREIAALNPKLKNPHRLKVGTSLLLEPARVAQRGELARYTEHHRARLLLAKTEYRLKEMQMLAMEFLREPAEAPASVEQANEATKDVAAENKKAEQPRGPPGFVRTSVSLH